jgi:hypothetical protein
MTHLTATTAHRAHGKYVTLEAIRAEALFASTLQSSRSPSPDQVRREVNGTLRRLGISGCAERLACEFGDHPDSAVTRMSWALATIRAVYPSYLSAPGTTPATSLAPAS